MESKQHLYNTLHSLLVNNYDYFNSVCTATYAKRFVRVLSVIRERLESLEANEEQLRSSVASYDLDENTPCNGYRTILTLTETFLHKSIALCRAICLKRNSMFFSGIPYCKELEAHASVFGGFCTGTVYMKKIMDRNLEGELFSPDGHLSAQELLEEYGSLDQTGFYGRCMGFYYCESMRHTLMGVGVIMASFSDLYENSGGALSHVTSSLINGGKYSFYPEARARQIVYVAQNASVEFIKAFWSLSESHFMKYVPTWLCPTPVVNEELFVPDEPLQISKIDGTGIVDIPVPSSHIPHAPVRCRLISFVQRKGQYVSGKSNPTIHDLCPSLLIHCHGGGFIAHSPEAHEIYLRDWAKDLNIPILSIDYSLAPLAPFPRALEEILLVYVWALKNCERLGSTAKQVCFAGDSAGGNLMMGLALKTIELGIRSPDGILCAYTPFILDLIPSPSRVMCTMDSLLPLGFMLSCLDAYCGNALALEDDDEVFVEESSKQGDRKKSITATFDSSIKFVKGMTDIDMEDKPMEEEFNEFEVVGVASCSNSPESPTVPTIGVTSSTSVDAAFAGEYSEEFMKKFVKSNTFPRANVDNDYNEHLIFEMPNDLSFNLQRRCCKATRNYVQKLSDLVTGNSFYKRHFNRKKVELAHNHVPWFQQTEKALAHKFQKIKIISRSPFMSPLLAPEEMLKQMPPVFLVSPTYDPTLDDSVMFARRLRKAGCQVRLENVDKLPHGFLNFLPFSREAHEGSKVCVKLLKEAFHLDYI